MYFLFSVKSILNVKLSEATGKPSNVSVLDLPGDVLIVPQVSHCIYIEAFHYFFFFEQKMKIGYCYWTKIIITYS